VKRVRDKKEETDHEEGARLDRARPGDTLFPVGKRKNKGGSCRLSKTINGHLTVEGTRGRPNASRGVKAIGGKKDSDAKTWRNREGSQIGRYNQRTETTQTKSEQEKTGKGHSKEDRCQRGGVGLPTKSERITRPQKGVI